MDEDRELLGLSAWALKGDFCTYVISTKISRAVTFYIISCNKISNTPFILDTSTEKPVLSGHSNRRPKIVFKTNYCLMQVKNFAECSKGSLVLSIFEWPFKAGFTVFRFFTLQSTLHIHEEAFM